MNRYLYYSILMGMLMNTILYVPNILIINKQNGLILGIIVSTFIGTLLAYLFTRAMSKFRNQTLPEVIQMYFPKPLSSLILLYLGFMWFMAGSIVLLSFTTLTKKYILPDTPSSILLTLFTLTICWGASRTTKSTLYMLEISLLISVPLIAMILYRSATSELLNWFVVLDIFSDRLLIVPNWEIIAAATYVYTGYINLAIFNKEIDRLFPFRLLWTVPAVGVAILLFSSFIPLGYLGSEGAAHYVNVWVSTADSLRIELGIVERVIYVFLLLYLNLTLLFTSVTWHVGSQLIRSIQKRNIVIRSFNFNNFLIFGSFALITFFCLWTLNEKQNFTIARYWLKIRFWSEVLLVLTVYYLSRKMIRR